MEPSNTTMIDRTNVAPTDVPPTKGKGSIMSGIFRRGSSAGSNDLPQNTAPPPLDGDDAINEVVGDATAAVEASEEVIANTETEEVAEGKLEDVELEAPTKELPETEAAENKPLKKRNVVSAIFRRESAGANKSSSPSNDTEFAEAQAGDSTEVEASDSKVISAIFRRGNEVLPPSGDVNGAADSCLARDSQLDSAVESAAVAKTSFISNMIHRARSQKIDDLSEDEGDATKDVDDAVMDELPKEADADDAPAGKTGKGSFIAAMLKRARSQTFDETSTFPHSDGVAQAEDVQSPSKENQAPLPPRTPEESPKSPAMDFEFTPLSPMYLTKNDDIENTESSDNQKKEKLDTLIQPSMQVAMQMETPPFQRAQPQQEKDEADGVTPVASSSPSLPSPAPPSPIIVDEPRKENAADVESPNAWVGLDEEYKQISASEPPGMTPRLGLSVEETNSAHSKPIDEDKTERIESDNVEQNVDDVTEEDNGHDPPGYLPSWKDDIKELEESRTEEVDQMKEELDVIFNDIDESAHDLKHSNPWMTTPVIKKLKNGSSKQPSPAGSDFQNMVSCATLGPTPDSTPVSTPIMGSYPRTGSVSSGAETPLRDQSPSRSSDFLNTSTFSDVDPSKETPVRSNLTYAQLDAQGEAAFVNGMPMSKMHGAVSSSVPSVASSDNDSDRYTPAIGIQSNTPRTRKILEWLDPSKRKNHSVSDTWPVPSMATKVRVNETPERQLPTRQRISNDNTQHAQVRRISDWWVPRPTYSRSNSSSPVSLPSMLGNSSQNEVSDLESPNMTYPILNFKFSEEESTINSQSVQDQASEMHSNGGVSPSLRSMLHNTYSLHGAGTGLEPPTPQSIVSSYTSGCPTDENCSPTEASKKSAAFQDDIESNRQTIEQIPTAETIDTSDAAIKNSRGNVPRTSRCCRRGAISLLLLVIVAVITIPLCFKYLQLDGSDNDFSTENLPTVTESPSIAVSLPTPDTESPTAVPTIAFDFSPSAIPPDENVGGSTQAPSSFDASMTVAPSSSVETDGGSESLSWDRIENGEGIWRSNTADDSPVWYFSNPQDQDFKGLTGVNLEIINAADDLYATYLRRAADDYRASEAVASLQLSNVPYQSLCQPENGKVKICSGEYGNTDWYGSTALFMRGNSIIAAIIRMNNSKNGSAQVLQHTVCHQLGHALGLQHSDQASCLQDLVGAAVDETAISNQLQHPSPEDLEMLVTMYGPIRRL
jgi:hypothetical protein